MQLDDDSNRSQPAGRGGVVKLNIGGRVFATSASTLTQNGTSDNLFSRMLSGKFATAMVDGDQYFIDRNGDYFVPLLDYLRTGHWHVPQHLDQRMVLREADFYGIEPNWETNLTDETIPLLQKGAKQKAIDAQGERAVEKIKKYLLRQLRRGRLDLRLLILEDREVLATAVAASWLPAVLQHLTALQETTMVLFDSDLFASLADTNKGERVRQCLADQHFLTVGIAKKVVSYNSKHNFWTTETDSYNHWVGPPAVKVAWRGR